LISLVLLSGILAYQSVTSHTDAAVGINHQINFQGKLVNPNGTNVTDGSYSIVFSIYNVASAGSAIWTETQSVTTTNGIFQVNLGSVTSLPGSVDFNTDNIYLGIKVGADAEMTPRVQFTSVPQAFNSEKLGGLTSSGFIQNQTATTQTADFKISGAGTIGTSLTTPQIQSAAATALSITGNAASTWSTSAGNLTLQAGSGTVSLGTSTILTAGGALSVTSGGATTLTLDTGGAAQLNIGTGSANAVSISKTGVTTTVNGNLTVAANQNFVMTAGSGTFTQTYSVASAGNAQSIGVTNTNSGAGVTVQGINLTPTNTTAASSGTNLINVVNFAAGGALLGSDNTNGINFASATGYTNFLKTPTAVLTSGGGLSGLTALASAGTIQFSALTTNGVLHTSGANGTLAVSAVLLGSEVSGTLPATNGGTGQNTYAVGDLLVGDVTNTLSKISAVATGSCLISQGVTTKPVWGSCASGGIVQAPTSTAQNTITPTTASVVGLTVNGTSSTAATALVVNQSGAADGIDLNLTNTSGTQTNGLSVVRNGAGGTTTNLLNLTNTAGTATNALSISGTFTNLISSTNFTVTNAGVVNAGTGYQIAGAAATGNYLRGNGTNFVSSAIQAGDIPSGSGNYIQNTSSPQTANFNITGNATITGTTSLYGAIQHYSFNNVIAASAGWFKLGTVTLPQNGYNATITMYAGTGYNATDSQDASATLQIRTSNGSSTNASGFAASAILSQFGNGAAFTAAKLVSNAAGTAATSYDVYINTATFIGVGYYTVDLNGGSWTNVMSTAADPGANSSTVYAASNVFSVASNVGIGTTAPSYKLDVQGGDINTSANLRTGGTIRLDTSGNLSNIGTITASGHTAFGSGATIDQNTISPINASNTALEVINARETITSVAQSTYSAGVFDLTYNPTANNTSSVVGASGTARTAVGNTFNTSALFGTVGQAANNSSGTLTTSVGTYGVTTNNGGTISQGVGVAGVVQAPGGTITTADGVYSQLRYQGGSIGTGYGYYGDAPTGTITGTYYAATFLGGNVGIGTATPGQKLTVVGTTNTSELQIANNYGLSTQLTTDESVQGSLRFVTTHTGSGNLYTYQRFTTTGYGYTVVAGDYLEFDEYCQSGNTNGICDAGIDITATDSTVLRGVGAVDQNGINPTSSDVSAYAVNRWYHRKVSLSGMVGKTLDHFDVVEETDTPGSYSNFFRKVILTNGSTLKSSVWDNNAPTGNATDYTSGGSGITLYGPFYRSIVDNGALTVNGGATITGTLTANELNMSTNTFNLNGGSTYPEIGFNYSGKANANFNFYNGANSSILNINGSNGNLTTIGQILSTVATGTAPLSVSSTTLVPNLNVQYLNGYSENQLASNLRSNVNISGGGTVSFSSFVYNWTTRFIVISNGNGSDFSTSGYYDINMPANGTVITGVGGHANVTVSSGIAMGAWDALYYILPIGSSSTSLNANFRIATYSSALQVPSNWVLIGVENGDNSTLKTPIGSLTNGSSMTQGGIGGGSGNYIQNQTASPQTAGFNINGSGTFGGEVIGTLGSGSGQFRAVAGNYGTMIRNDGANTYFLLTASGSPYGGWNGLRPITIGDSDGMVSLGNFQLTVRDSGYVGIGLGATAPVTLLANTATNYLDYFGNGNNGSGLAWAVNGGGTTLNLYNASTSAASNGILVGVAGTTSAQRILEAESGGATRLIVRADGNVGIGNSSPNATLNIGASYGSTAFSSVFQANSGVLGTTAGNELKLGTFGASVDSNGVGLGMHLVRVTSGSGGWTQSNIVFTMDVDATESAGGASLTIGSNGNIGVGNYQPNFGRLTVTGTGDQKGANGAALALLAAGTAQSQRAVQGFYGTFENTADSAPRRTADITAGFNGGAWGTEYLSFNVGSSGGANDAGNLTVEQARITNTGLGVGTAAPQAKLDIESSISGQIGTLLAQNSYSGGDALRVMVSGASAGTAVSYTTASNASQYGTVGGRTTAKLDSTHFVSLHNNSNFIYAEVGSTTGNAVGYTAETQVTNSAIPNSYYSVAGLSSTSFVVVYGDNNSPWAASAYVCTISGTTISCGTKATIDSQATYSGTPAYLTVTALSSSSFVMGYGTAYAGGTFVPRVVAATVSGTTITFGTPVSAGVNAGGFSYYNQSIAALSSTSFVDMYQYSSNGLIGIAGTVSGTTITLGSAVTVPGTSGNSYQNDVQPISSTSFLLGYVNSSSNPMAMVGTVSGTTITYSAGYNVGPTMTSTEISLAQLSSTTYVMSYNNSASHTDVYSSLVTVSGTSLGIGTAYDTVVNTSPFTGTTVSTVGLSSSTFYTEYYHSTYATPTKGMVGNVTSLAVATPTNISYTTASGASGYGTDGGRTTAKLDSTHFVALHNNSNFLYAEVGSTTGNAVGYTTETVITTSSNNNSYYSVAGLSSTSFVVVYSDSNSPWAASAYVCTINGTTISCGTKATIDSEATYSGIPPYLTVTALSSTSFVMGYGTAYASSTFVPRVVAATVSGTTITFGTPVSTGVNAGGFSYYNQSIAALSSTSFINMYEYGSNGLVGIAGTVSGTTITVGSAVTVPGSSTGANQIDVQPISSTSFLVGYVNNSNNPMAMVGTVSGTTVSYNTSYNLGSALTSSEVSLAQLSSTTYVMSYNNSASHTDVYSSLVTVSGTSLSIGTAYDTVVNTSPFTGTTVSSVGLSSSMFYTEYYHSTYAAPTKGMVGNVTSNTSTKSIASDQALTITNSGEMFVRVADPNSANAFQVQNASGSTLFNVSGAAPNGYIASILNPSTTTTSSGLLIDLGNRTGTGTGGNIFVGFSSGGAVGGKIQTSNATTVSYLTTGADYAEYFNADSADLPKPGELVSLAGGTTNKVIRSQSQAPMGVISTNPGFIGNSPICKVDDTNCDSDYQKYNVLVSLTGQVPVKVTVANGAIQAGDPITSSAIAGVGQKATAAGQIVGYALSATDVDGTVQVLINPGFYNPTDADNIQAKNISTETLQTTGDMSVGGSMSIAGGINVAGAANLGSLNVSGSAVFGAEVTVKGNLTVENDLVVMGATSVQDITVNGHVITAGDAPVTAALTAAGSSAQVTVTGNDTSGTITITTGQQTTAMVNGKPVANGTDPSIGDLLTLTFNKAYGRAVQVSLTPANPAAADMHYFVQGDADKFTLSSTTAPAKAQTYSFTYFVRQ